MRMGPAGFRTCDTELRSWDSFDSTTRFAAGNPSVRTHHTSDARFRSGVDAVSSVSGIDVRHQKHCASKEGRRCNCRPAYRARVRQGRTGKVLTKSFPTAAEARAWRARTAAARYDGTLPAPEASRTIRDASKAMFDGMYQGVIRTRTG